MKRLTTWNFVFSKKRRIKKLKIKITLKIKEVTHEVSRFKKYSSRNSWDAYVFDCDNCRRLFDLFVILSVEVMLKFYQTRNKAIQNNCKKGEN